MNTDDFISAINHFLQENMSKNIHCKGFGRHKRYYVSGGVLTDLRAFIKNNFEIQVRDLGENKE